MEYSDDGPGKVSPWWGGLCNNLLAANPEACDGTTLQIDCCAGCLASLDTACAWQSGLAGAGSGIATLDACVASGTGSLEQPDGACTTSCRGADRGIDEPSLAALKLAPPLPRRLHAQLVDALSEAGAAGLGVDLLLSAGQTAEDDAALARALQGRLPVVLASADVVVRSSQVAQYQQHVASIYPQARHGSVAMPVDDDGVVRAAPGEEGALWRQLALAAGRAIVVPPPVPCCATMPPEVALPLCAFHPGAGTFEIPA